MGALYVPTFLEEVRAGKPRSYLVSHGAVALAMVAIYWWSGYAIGRRRKAGAITAISVSTLVAVLVMTPPDLGGIIVAAINITIVALLLFNWRHLRSPSTGVGA